MKKLLSIVLFVCVSFSLFAQTSALPKLAVVEFTGNAPDDAATVREMVERVMIDSGKFDMVDTHNIDQIIAQQRIALSSISSTENITKLERANIKYIVTGTVRKQGAESFVSLKILDVSNAVFIPNSPGGVVNMSSMTSIYRGVSDIAANFLSGMKSDGGDVTRAVQKETGTNDVIPTVIYQSHVQGIGWQAHTTNGGSSGTTGQSRRLEAFRIHIDVPAASGGIRYNAHVAGIGWQNFVSNDTIAGTTGQSRAIEAIRIELTGDLAVKFDVYYRAHVTSIGWMDWVLNGITAGTTGQSRRIEAFQVVLTKKNGPGPR